MLFIILCEFEVRMSQCLLSGNSLVRIYSEHLLQQIECLWGNLSIKFFLKVILACPVLCQHFIVSFFPKQTKPEQEHMEDESKTKNITDGAVFFLHVLNVNDLRGYISWSSTTYKQILIRIDKLGKPEISNHTFYFIFAPQQNIFRLQVSMHNAFAMHFLKPFEKVPHH